MLCSISAVLVNNCCLLSGRRSRAGPLALLRTMTLLAVERTLRCLGLSPILLTMAETRISRPPIMAAMTRMEFTDIITCFYLLCLTIKIIYCDSRNRHTWSMATKTASAKRAKKESESNSGMKTDRRGFCNDYERSKNSPVTRNDIAWYSFGVSQTNTFFR